MDSEEEDEEESDDAETVVGCDAEDDDAIVVVLTRHDWDCCCCSVDATDGPNDNAVGRGTDDVLTPLRNGDEEFGITMPRRRGETGGVRPDAELPCPLLFRR